MMLGAGMGRKVPGFARYAGPLAAALLMAGCVSLGGGDPPKQLISLTPQNAAPAGELGSSSQRDALVVLDPEADRRLDVQRVPVQVDDATIAYLKRSVSQRNSWELLKGGKGRAQAPARQQAVQGAQGAGARPAAAPPA